jgi:CRP-like cAMP-binding protein
VIQSGSVRLGVSRAGRPAKPLGPGDLFGEESFPDRAPRAATAEIMEGARLLEVKARTLDALTRHGPRTAQRIAEKLLELTRGARGDLALWTIGHLLRRLAPFLVAPAPGGIDTAELAERSGLAVSDVGAALAELERHGCLAREGAGYRAPDAALLQRVVSGLTAAGGPA